MSSKSPLSKGTRASNLPWAEVSGGRSWYCCTDGVIFEPRIISLIVSDVEVLLGDELDTEAIISFSSKAGLLDRRSCAIGAAVVACLGLELPLE